MSHLDQRPTTIQPSDEGVSPDVVETPGRADPHEETALAPAAAWVAGGAGTVPRYSNVRLLLVLAAVVGGWIWVGPYVIVAILALVISIFLHECGHYWVAKATGMKATEFFIGFGPRIWSFRRGETEFGFKAIPAGAYVRIIGMTNLEEVDPSDEARSYRAKGTFKRLAVVLAGPAMNIALCFLLLFSFYLATGKGDPNRWTVDNVGKGSAAEAVGIRTGDRIISANGEPVGAYLDFRSTVRRFPGQTLRLEVERNGQRFTVEPTLRWRLNDQASKLLATQPRVEPSDMLVSVNGEPLASYEQLRSTMARPQGTAKVVIERRGHLYETDVSLPVALPEDGAGGMVGLTPTFEQERENPIGATGETVSQMGSMLGMTVTGMGRLLTPSGLSGYASQVADGVRPDESKTQVNVLRPVGDAPDAAMLGSEPQDRPVSVIGIVSLGSGSLQSGVWEFVLLMAILNLSLAFLNLLPLPPFDGGHAVIAVYEGIRGRLRGAAYRIDFNKVFPVTIGVIVVFAIFALPALLLDIVRPPSVG